MTDVEIEATFVQGDTSPPMQAVIHAWLDESDIEDLTDADVNFQMRKQDDKWFTVNQPAEIVDEVEGRVQYAWAANDLSVHGIYQVQWEITYQSGRIQTTHQRYIEVRRQ